MKKITMIVDGLPLYYGDELLLETYKGEELREIKEYLTEVYKPRKIAFVETENYKPQNVTIIKTKTERV